MCHRGEILASRVHPESLIRLLYLPSPKSALSILFVFSGDVGTLIDFFSFAIWTFYGLTFLSTIVLRWRRPLMERPFKVGINEVQV